MTKRSVKAILQRAQRATKPFSTVLGGEEIEGTLAAIPYMRFRVLLTDNPPRDGHLVDAGWGFCVASFWGAALREGWESPEMDDDDWDVLFAKMPVAEINRLGMEVYALTMSPVELDVPKSSSASQETTPPSSD